MVAVRDMQITKRQNWTVRTYREGDEDQLYELLRAVHPERHLSKEAWLKRWHWQYREFPYGVKTWLVEDNGKIIGHSSAQLMKLKIGNDIVKARFPFDLATHPDYRRQGVSSAISFAAREYYSKNGNHIAYGVPNKSGYKVGKTRSFMDVASWIRIIRVLNWENFLSKHIRNKFFLKLCTTCVSTLNKLFFRAHKAPAINGLVIKQVSCFDERINEFLARISSKFQITVVKNMDYLNWKYASFLQAKYYIYTAEKEGTICGYLVLSEHQDEHNKEALVDDMIAESEDVAQCLISTITEYCRKDNVDHISWVGLANKRYLRAFRKQGFFSYSYRNKWKFTVYSSHPSISEKYLTNPRNWFIQRGDLDII